MYTPIAIQPNAQVLDEFYDSHRAATQREAAAYADFTAMMNDSSGLFRLIADHPLLSGVVVIAVLAVLAVCLAALLKRRRPIIGSTLQWSASPVGRDSPTTAGLHQRN